MLWLVLSVFFLAPISVHAAEFSDAWTSAQISVKGSKLFVSKSNSQTTLHIRQDLADSVPAVNTNTEDLKNAINVYRSAFQKMLGLGKFRSESLQLRSLGAGTVQELLSAVYVDQRGRRFYLYEEQVFFRGKVTITQLSTPLPLEKGLSDVQNIRVSFQKSLRGVAAEETEGTGVCEDCIVEKAGLFAKTMKDLNDVAEKTKQKDRASSCEKVKKEKRSMLSGLIGETEYKTWDEQFNDQVSNITAARTELSCFAGFGKEFVIGLVDPFVMLGKGLWWAAKNTPNAVVSLFDKETWKSVYETTKKLPDTARSVATSAANVGAVALTAARDPVGTVKTAGQAMARMVNAYLVNQVPEFMCLTPEAKAEMLCGMIGYMVGSVVDPIAIIQLVRLGKFAELGEWMGKAYQGVKGKFVNAEEKSVAKTSEAAAKKEAIEVEFTRVEEVKPGEVKSLAGWAEEPKRQETILTILEDDQTRKAEKLEAAGKDVAQTLSRWKDPKADWLLETFQKTLSTRDEGEIQSAREFMALLKKRKRKRFL